MLKPHQSARNLWLCWAREWFLMCLWCFHAASCFSGPACSATRRAMQLRTINTFIISQMWRGSFIRSHWQSVVESPGIVSLLYFQSRLWVLYNNKVAPCHCYWSKYYFEDSFIEVLNAVGDTFEAEMKVQESRVKQYRPCSKYRNLSCFQDNCVLIIIRYNDMI